MATKTAEASEDQVEAPAEAHDGPVLDMSDAAVKKLIKVAKARGFVTYDELNEVLPSEEVSSEQIEDTMAMLSDMGINVIDTDEAEEPTAAGEEGAGDLWPANHKLVPVTVSLTFTDALSGRSAFAVTNASSSEPDNGLGDGDTAGDIRGFVPGGLALGGSLRAERAGGGNGRVYTLEYQGFDAEIGRAHV